MHTFNENSFFKTKKLLERVALLYIFANFFNVRLNRNGSILMSTFSFKFLQ